MATLLALAACRLVDGEDWSGAGALLLSGVFTFGALIWDPFAATPAADLGAAPRGMNAHLLSPWMALHPPLLFAAYVLVLAPFGGALQALARGDGAWARRHGTWLRSAWLILSSRAVRRHVVGLRGLQLRPVLALGPGPDQRVRGLGLAHRAAPRGRPLPPARPLRSAAAGARRPCRDRGPPLDGDHAQPGTRLLAPLRRRQLAPAPVGPGRRARCPHALGRWSKVSDGGAPARPDRASRARC